MDFLERHECQKETTAWLIAVLEYISTQSAGEAIDFDKLYPILREFGDKVNQWQREAVKAATDGEITNYEGSFPKIERLSEHRSEADEEILDEILNKRGY